MANPAHVQTASRKFRRRGELERTWAVLEESQDLARSLDDEEGIARSHENLSLVLLQSGAVDEAEEHEILRPGEIQGE